MGEAAGTSERTLQHAFKEMMGMTSVANLSRPRLHRARSGTNFAKSFFADVFGIGLG
jgi:transcriptional regulator GlxA family with amidase domain